MKQARIEEIARELEPWFRTFEWEWASAKENAAGKAIPNAQETARTIRELIQDCPEDEWIETGRIRVQTFKDGTVEVALIPVSFDE